ncbi:MAG: sugar transferase [candidate division KSB1 bacterium]|nr:sugar transferase [candidate division KSB1 bacterium]MDZ7276008.1 sugar transferase [candidate division KSB1 bacterium]MDZ7285710.1 sugar transferase [candidate division KSB1 bacterium]MDZ7298742.1 sugar transferase [candidate division KSB1 bacterium]MDZ7305925.1 sugar transferase [candidate division KSB1 bacterium]
MVREKQAFLSNLVRMIDAAVILLAFVISYFVSFHLREVYQLGEMAFAVSPDLEGLLYFAQKNRVLLGFCLLIWIATLSFIGAYRDFRTKTLARSIWQIFLAGAVTLLMVGTPIFAFQLFLTSRLFIATFWGITIVLLLFERYLLNLFLDYIHSRGYNHINLLIVGTGKRAREFIRTVKSHSSWGLNIVGLIDDDHGMFGKEIEGYRVLGRLQDIPFILHRKVIDRVIFVVPRLWLNRIDEAILACEREGIPTSISMDLYNLRIATVRQTDFSGFPLLEFETFSAQAWQLFVKRVLDVVLALVLILLLSPVFVLIALAIKLTSRGPVLFKQTRCGMNGRTFTLYKFRSMVVNAEMRKRELEKMNEMDGPVFKIKRDPRITAIGRILRKSSLDELPQLFNVLKGDMSFVGPRPPLAVEVELYKHWQRRRLSLKPGLTCIWQVSGRNQIGFEKWMEMDMEYIDNWSLWLDFKIMAKTVFVVLFGYGAS